jgi:hypothetical protein
MVSRVKGLASLPGKLVGFGIALWHVGKEHRVMLGRQNLAGFGFARLGAHGHSEGYAEKVRGENGDDLVDGHAGMKAFRNSIYMTHVLSGARHGNNQMDDKGSDEGTRNVQDNSEHFHRREDSIRVWCSGDSRGKGTFCASCIDFREP